MQVGQGEVALERLVLRGQPPQVVADRGEDDLLGQEGPPGGGLGRRLSEGGGPGVDPGLQGGDLLGRGPGLLVLRRHLAGLHPLEQPRLGGVAGDHLLARDELPGVEDEPEAALGLPVGVAADSGGVILRAHLRR